MPRSSPQPPAVDHRPLTPAVFQILLALADQPRHGYAILQDVAERTGGAVRLGTGTLYTAIRRLLDRGWIEELEDSVPPDAVGSERSRRVYRLAPEGREVAAAEARRLEAVVAAARERRLLAARSGRD